MRTLKNDHEQKAKYTYILQVTYPGIGGLLVFGRQNLRDGGFSLPAVNQGVRHVEFILF